MSWSGWGDPEQAVALPAAMTALLRDGLGVKRENPRPPTIAALELEPVRLPADVAARLTEVVGASHAAADHEARSRHALGRSTPDLLALRAGRRLPAPDLVLAPADHGQVLEILGQCSRARVAVVPFGGGTSVVGGLRPDAADYAGWVTLDLRRMNAVLDVDEESRLARLEPGLRGPEAETALQARGYTLGHFPQSFEFATLGGFAAARSSGQASAGYGRFDELVLGLKVATPSGTLRLGRAPRTAAGPDLRQLMLGSEGTLGVITELTLQIRPVPEVRLYEGWRFPSFATGTATIQALAQDGPVPTVMRLSDEAETALGLARPEQLATGQDAGSLAVVGFEGTADEVAARRELVTARLRAGGAEPVPEAGQDWSQGRYRAPYLRDALLDAGALVETLETATWWSGLSGLYTATAAALQTALGAQGTPAVVLCHISHVYPAGASLYFTVACAQSEDPIGQWQQAKRAATDAIVAAGATITHHHGVGSEHRPWLADEIGELGCAVLRAAQLAVDPEAILNPGILIGA